MTNNNNNNKTSLFVQLLHIYLHDKPTDLGEENNNSYYYAFLQSFAFWKFFLLFALALIIGIINLINKKPVDEEMKNNTGYWIIEWVLLTFAFFIPCIFMYLLRDPMNINFTLWNMIKTFIVLLIICFFKHLDFQLSGLYRWKFSSKKCLKYKEHFKEDENKKEEENKEENKKEEENKEENKKEEENKEEKTKCNCDDSNFDGPLWDGLGWFGLLFTIVLFIFFSASLSNPDLTTNFFGIKFTRKYSLIIISLIIGIFLAGFFLIKTFKNKDCSNNDTFNSVRDGGACVTVVFTTIITFLPLIILGLWKYNCPKCNLNLNYSKSVKSEIHRGIIVLIEIIITWVIFTLVEAGIESIRKEEDLIHILKNKHLWFSSSSVITLLVIAYLQIILEYSGWFYMHLFKKNQINKTK